MHPGPCLPSQQPTKLPAGIAVALKHGQVLLCSSSLTVLRLHRPFHEPDAQAVADRMTTAYARTCLAMNETCAGHRRLCGHGLVNTSGCNARQQFVSRRVQEATLPDHRRDILGCSPGRLPLLPCPPDWQRLVCSPRFVPGLWQNIVQLAVARHAHDGAYLCCFVLLTGLLSCRSPEERQDSIHLATVPGESIACAV